MKVLISITFFILGIFNAVSQINSFVEEFELPALLNEPSGVIYFNNNLITHNDSTGENKLYEFDINTGFIVREVTISNATNFDWEDLTQDNNYIYIGDIGNNRGNRTDLKIYKIDKNDYLNSTSVTAEIIFYSYSDQTDFTETPNNETSWDAQALVSFNESHLIVFTKNWINETTKGYLVPKTPGTFSITPLPTPLNNAGLITGGTYNHLSGKLFLVGYSQTLQPFVWKCEDFTGNDVFSTTNTQTFLPASFNVEKTEAITFVDENNYYILSEEIVISNVRFDYPKLISFSTNDLALSFDNIDMARDIILYPNPVTNILHIKNKKLNSVEVYDMKSTKIYSSFNKIIDMSSFSDGIYMIKINLNDDYQVIKKVVKK